MCAVTWWFIYTDAQCALQPTDCCFLSSLASCAFLYLPNKVGVLKSFAISRSSFIVLSSNILSPSIGGGLSN